MNRAFVRYHYGNPANMGERKPVMQEECGFWNGQKVLLSEMKISVFDRGVVHGQAITEMLRTFRGEINELSAHLERFEHSAQLCGIPLAFSLTEIAEQLSEMVAHNFQVHAGTEELGVIVSATPGLNSTYTGETVSSPTLYAHTFVLPGELWERATREGQTLAFSRVPQIPEACLPVHAKTRSRMSWHLADAEVGQRVPGARALLLDLGGSVRETSTANFFAVINHELWTAPEATVLAGIGRKVVLELAEEAKIPVYEQDFTPDDLQAASECFTTSTPYCLLPVSSVEGRRIGTGVPGPVTAEILSRWNARVGLDIHAQLRKLAVRHRQKKEAASP